MEIYSKVCVSSSVFSSVCNNKYVFLDVRTRTLLGAGTMNVDEDGNEYCEASIYNPYSDVYSQIRPTLL